MSDQFIEIEVGEKAYKFNKILMPIVLIAGIILLLLGAITGNVTLLIVGIFILLGGLLLYLLVAAGSNIRLTMESSEILKRGLLTAMLIIGSIGFVLIVVFVL